MTDPTNVIDTYDGAQVLAHAMLRLAPDPASTFWQSVSEPLLGALLYAASPLMDGAGIGWVHDTVVAMAAGSVFTPAPGTPQVHAARAASIQRMDERQRLSVLKTLRGAIEPWVDADHGARVA